MSCEDVNECNLANMHNCSVHALCSNTFGSYDCACLKGFHGDGILCHDNDECNSNMHNCSVNVHCSNTIGSYNCTCAVGFHGDGMSCQDVDECKGNMHNFDYER